jgi:RHS repeat-associated protein
VSAGPRQTLIGDGAGGATLQQDGRALYRIAAPVAIDAQGASVPVTMAVTRAGLVLRVAHRGADVAYPIRVDPAITTVSSFNSWALVRAGQGSQSIHGSAGGGAAQVVADASSGYAPATPYSNDTASLARVSWMAPMGYLVSTLESTVTGSVGAGYLAGRDADAAAIVSIDCSSQDNGHMGRLASLTVENVYGLQRDAEIGQHPAHWSANAADLPCADGISVWLRMADAVSTISQQVSVSAMVATLRSVGPSSSELNGPHSAAEKNVRNCFAGDPVNCATGNQYEQQTDLSVGGRGLGLRQQRTYNTQVATTQTTAGVQGFGWTASYSDHLMVDAAAKIATVTQADGSTVPFDLNADGTFSSAPWVQATLAAAGSGYRFTLPDRRAFLFDSNGQLSSEQDANGVATTITHDAQGRVSVVTDEAGRRLTYTYNAAGLVGSITDPAGQQVSYGYDAAKNLTSVTQPDGAVWQFGYDASHRLTSLTDPRSATTTSTYDSAHRVVSQSDALGRLRTWTYGEHETVITEPNGSITHEYFAGTEPTKIIHAEGTAQQTQRTIAYDAAKAPISMTDERAKTWTYGYDSAGNQTTVTDPLNHTTISAFNAARDLLSVTTPSGQKRSFTYDPAGNPLTVTRASADNSKRETTTFVYDADGDLVRITDPLQHTTTIAYDAYGNQTSVTTALGRITSYGYDQDSRLISRVSPKGNQTAADPANYRTTWTLDGVGRPTESVDPLGRHTKASYDAAGNVASSTDAAGRKTIFGYDAENELITVTRPDGTVLKTAYDNAGQIVKQIDPNTHATTYTRDRLERVTKRTDPLNRATTYAYDDAGHLTSSTDALQRTTNHAYNDAGQLTQISYSSGTPAVAALGYDADGRLTSNGDVSFGYDSLGRLASTTNGSAGNTTYSYDDADRLTTIGYPTSGPSAGTTVTHTLDADGQITAITDGHQHQSTYAYDADGHITDVTRPDTSSEHDTYDRAGQLTAINDTSQAGYSFKSTYAHTTAGQISGADETQNTLGSALNYGYDTARRLTTNGHNAAYGYDAADNLTSRPVPAKSTTILGIPVNPAAAPTYDTVTQAFDAANQLTSTSTTGSGAGPATTYQYDADGQRTQSSTPASGTCITPTICTTPAHATTYTYDQAGQLTTYADTATTGTTATYTYDATGLRKTQGTQINPNTWDRSSPIAQLLSDNTNAYIYGPDGLPLEAIGPNTSVTVYHHDVQGSTRAITNTNGAPQATYTYDPYGALNGNIKTAATTNPFLYAGQYTDPTGLQYLRARYYDPTSGQFITRDPIENLTGHAYGYADGDPVDASDPSGLSCGWTSPQDCLGGVGSAASALGGVAYKYSGQISTIASALALVPGVDVVAARIAIGAGLLHGYQDYSDHNYVGMGLDIVGAASGLAGVALKSEADAWEAAERTAWNRGYLRRWAANEAGDAAERYTRFSFGTYATNSLLDPLLHPENANGAICGGA